MKRSLLNGVTATLLLLTPTLAFARHHHAKKAVDTTPPAASNPALAGRGIGSYRELRKLVADRPGHDRRYAIDDAKIEGELGWTPRQSFEEGLRATVRWYLGHREWCEAVQSGRYGRERLGLGTDSLKSEIESEVQAG